LTEFKNSGLLNASYDNIKKKRGKKENAVNKDTDKNIQIKRCTVRTCNRA